MFQIQKDFEHEFNRIKYTIHLRDDKFFDGFHNQRWEGNEITVSTKEYTCTVAFVIYAPRGCAFKKVSRSFSKLTETGYAYLVDQAFYHGYDFNKMFGIYYTGKKGLWEDYNKKSVRYKSEVSDTQFVKDKVAEYLMEEKKIKEQSTIPVKVVEEIEKKPKSNEIMKLAQMTDYVLDSM